MKKRLDILLVERGFAESRARAQALVIAGRVHGYDKPGHQVDEAVELTVEQPPRYVSRGGEKLAHGLDALGVDPAGLECVDGGASTGGFTDDLPQRGAARVIAIDVGYGQLHPRLRGDARVTVLERTNARKVTELPFAPQLAVCDVSFISVRIALPPVLRLCAPGWQAVVLVKPQFGAGREDVGKGGDGTILRTLARLLGKGVPVIGVNFGRVGFLASIVPERLEADLARVFAGEYRVIEQPTLVARLDGTTFAAVNDVVAASSTLGRMVELSWAIAGEELGVVSCDGMICSTPSGSTAYNLSNGGPVLVRGLDAMAITFIAPHSLHARPLVVPRGAELTVRNATPDVGAAVLADGAESGDLAPEGALSIRLGEQRSLLATLPETTFFARYRETFTS